MKKYKALLFDMDGTLIDSMYQWRLIWKEYVEENHIEKPEPLKGQNRFVASHAAKILAEAYGKSEDYYYEGMMQVLLRHYKTDIPVKPNVYEALTYLKKQGYILCVATATHKPYALPVLERLHLNEYFDYVTETKELDAHKSETEYFTRAAQRLGVPVEDCVMFEDALYSIRTAKKAGMAVCAKSDDIADLQGDKPEILRLSDWYIHDWNEVKNIF